MSDLEAAEAGLERMVALRIEHLPEGLYLATSDDVPGLVAQGRTIRETLEIAGGVARKLMELRGEAAPDLPPPAPEGSFDYTLIVAA